MPCDSTPRRLPNRKPQTLAERNVEVKEALKRLERYLATGSVRVVVGRNGAIAFAGWKEEDKAGLSDVCSYRCLSAEKSWELRKAVQRAEAQSGRKVSEDAILAGYHSHDGGRNFSKD